MDTNILDKDARILFSKRIRVSIIDNRYIPELCTYGPKFNYLITLEKVVSLLDRKIIVRFQSANDVYLVREFLDKYFDLADAAEAANTTARVNRPEHADKEIEKLINRMEKRTVEVNVFDDKKDNEELELSLIKSYDTINDSRDNAKPADPEQEAQFRDRVQLMRKMTNINAQIRDDTDFDDIEMK